MSSTEAEQTRTPRGPLSGLRVLDLTTVIMGPAATQMLADMGADVIKFEAPEGDSLRRIGPGRSELMGTLFLQSNRNKRSLVLDLRDPADRQRLLDLAREADALLTNIRGAGLRRLGLEYADLRKVNPALVYCQMVGYGSDGPNAGQAVYDDLIQAAAGVCGVFQAVDGQTRYAPLNICDRVSGLYAAIAVLGALLERSLSGEGQAIEVPMFETMASFVTADHMGGASFVPPLGKPGYGRLLSRFRGPYPTRDGHLALVVYTDRDWKVFTDLVGRPEVLERPEFASQTTRTEHAETCGHFLREVLPQRTTAEWIAALRAADIPCSVVNGLADLFEDPHLKAVGLFQEFDHPTEGRITMARPPVRFGRTPAAVTAVAPNLGEHPAAGFEQLAYFPSRPAEG